MRPGVRVAVDAGAVRVGVAVSDPAGTVATPTGTLRRDPDRGSDLAELAAVCARRGAVEVVVGLPIALSGRAGPAAVAARRYARALAARVAPVPVRLVDERLTTVTADRALAAAGVPGRRRRQRVDAHAAAVLLQAALDRERATGSPPGELLAADA